MNEESNIAAFMDFLNESMNDGIITASERLQINDLKKKLGISDSLAALAESQAGNFVKAADGTYEHIDCSGMGILTVKNRIDSLKREGFNTEMTVNTFGGGSWHSTFTAKEWDDFKEAVNKNHDAVKEVWLKPGPRIKKEIKRNIDDYERER